jgi:SAM-dependent methyltransferase
VEIEPSGLIRLVGWARHPTARIVPPPVEADGRPLPPLKIYRYARGDVAPAADQLVAQAGIVVEYRLPAEATSVRAITVGRHRLALAGPLAVVAPHYGMLHDSAAVLHREHIYGSGPPSPVANAELLKLLEQAIGRVLDFGCGSGALVAWLRRRQVDAQGLELDIPVIQGSLTAEARPHVTLYDGRFPIPLADGDFDLVVASEVLEHIEDFPAAVAELARVCRGTLLVTVPDSEAIPAGFPHRLVPWHLLESTHVNFFTQRSLGLLLAPHFPVIEFGRIGSVRLNDTLYYESVVAVCRKQ